MPAASWRAAGGGELDASRRVCVCVAHVGKPWMDGEPTNEVRCEMNQQPI